MTALKLSVKIPGDLSRTCRMFSTEARLELRAETTWVTASWSLLCSPRNWSMAGWSNCNQS